MSPQTREKTPTPHACFTVTFFSIAEGLVNCIYSDFVAFSITMLFTMYIWSVTDAAGKTLLNSSGEALGSEGADEQTQ